MLRDQATTELRQTFASASQSGLELLCVLRHEFPTEWAAFAAADGDGPLVIRLRKSMFPYMPQSETLSIDGLDLWAADGTELVRRSLMVPASMADELNGDDAASVLSIESTRAC